MKSAIRLASLTTASMVAFAANSLLCREALATGNIGAADFTLVRLVSGAATLAMLVATRYRSFEFGGDWLSAAALFGYAACFSFAYVSLSAGTGALLLFGAVQVTMIGYGLRAGERLNIRQIAGVTMAVGGLIWLVLPGVEAPSITGALLMLGAGISWGVYSLLGRGTTTPTVATAGNFVRAMPFAVILYVVTSGTEEKTSSLGLGLGYAVASGALASGMGYALWYSVLPALSATGAATIQLSVPIIAALGGVLLLGEAVTLRFALASVAVLGGILLFLLNRRST
jgi:drug/metabolite transporter (DMT)-like permease